MSENPTCSHKHVHWEKQNLEKIKICTCYQENYNLYQQPNIGNEAE